MKKARRPFAKMILGQRTKMRMTQQQMAVYLAVPFSTFQNWEEDRRAPNALTEWAVREKIFGKSAK